MSRRSPAQSGLISTHARARGRESFPRADTRPIKIRSAFVEGRFTALMAGTETAGHVGGRGFLPLRNARVGRDLLRTFRCCDFFHPLLPLPSAAIPARTRDRPSSAQPPVVYRSLSTVSLVMQSLKVKHDAIIRRDILRLLALVHIQPGKPLDRDGEETSSS